MYGECLALRGGGRFLVFGGFDVLEAAEAAPAERLLRVLVTPPLPDAEVSRRAWFEVVRLIGLQLDRSDGPPSLRTALEGLPIDLSRLLFDRDHVSVGRLAAHLGTSTDLVSGRLGRLRRRG
jgi:hypothetical protein